MLLTPHIVLNSVLEIDQNLLQAHGLKGLVLDVDNTLTTHNNALPAEGVVNWVRRMTACGVKLILLSNNNRERVRPFAELLGLPYTANGMKPLPKGYLRAAEQLRLRPKEVGAVGDQLYTDMMGGNLAGMKTIFVFPLEPERGFFFSLKRELEKPFLPPRPSPPPSGIKEE